MSQILRCGLTKDVYMAEANIPRNRQRQDIPRYRQKRPKCFLGTYDCTAFFVLSVLQPTEEF